MDTHERAPFTTTMPLAFGIVQATSLGAIAGGLESVALAASSKLPLSLGGFFLLGVVDVMVMAGFASLVSALVGGVWFARPSARDPNADPVPGWSWQVGVTVFALVGWFLWFEAATRIERGDPVVGALALAAMPLGFAGLGYYNARFWFRWVERSHQPWGFPLGAAVGSLVLVIVATMGFSTRGTGGREAFDDDHSAVVVTVDGLSADLVDAVPTLTGLAGRPGGIVFDNAVTPTPGSRAANATVITGLHPLRHQVVTEERILSPRYPTLFRVVGEDGWQTAGFVSSVAVGAASGLGEDLDVLDDAFTPAAWLGQIDVLGRLRGWLGTATGHRDAGATVDAFASWLGRRDAKPFVAWIHLGDPSRAAHDGRDPATAVGEVDAALQRLLEILAQEGYGDDALVIVAGTHGTAEGSPPDRGLGEGVVHVPIGLLAPGEDYGVHQVSAQVRTLDVINSVSAYLGLPPIDTSEGISLLAYGEGDREASMSCTLVGRDAEGRWLLGLRNNGVKYWIDREGRETLYYLPDDPSEVTNLVAEQPKVLAQARAVLISERAAMQRLLWRE